MFADALDAAFLELDPSTRRVTAAFAVLCKYIVDQRGKIIAHSVLLNMLAEKFGTPLVTDGSLPVHVRSDHNGPAKNSVEIDASPLSAIWRSKLARESWRPQIKGAVSIRQRQLEV